MTLTKEIIEREMRIWERNGYIEGTVWARHYIDLCRLALLGLERDTRSERIGRAVLVAGDTARFALDVAIDHIRNGIGFEDDEIPKLRTIAAAMEDSDD